MRARIGAPTGALTNVAPAPTVGPPGAMTVAAGLLPRKAAAVLPVAVVRAALAGTEPDAIYPAISEVPGNSGPILKMPLVRSAGTPSALTRPCTKTRLRVTRSTCASPCTQAPSGAGAR